MRALVILCCSLVAPCAAQTSPYNGRSLVQPDSSGAYRLLIGGHFHGASSNVSGFPAATVLAGLDRINATRANAFLSTGDLFLDPDRDSARYVRSFFTKLDLPLFNAPGNHDLEGKAFREDARYPQVLRIGQDRIILLDTEKGDSRLKGAQLDVLRTLADSAGHWEHARVFIISHRPIWAEENARYSELFAGNTRSLLGTNFNADVLPLLQRIAEHVQVFWISGSMAGRAPSSIFFQPEAENITYIQCAVRDELRDALLIADVSPAGIEWSGLSLTGAALPEVWTMDADWWEAQRPRTDGFRWRLLPYLIRKNMGYPSFWYGVASMGLLSLLIGYLLRRLGRR
ncbi:MAG: metallophosphoesterase [Flavobacteriales bacterium]|nr:metallophosphoesterase [Flavobacteriales bacterium]